MPPSNIILFGRSLGTGPVVDLASRKPVRGVILQSPMLSGLRPQAPSWLSEALFFVDVFKSKDKVEYIQCPVLIMHGKLDDVVPWNHGYVLWQLLPNAYEPLWVEGAGHGDMELEKDENGYERRKAMFQHIHGFLGHCESERTGRVVYASCPSGLSDGNLSGGNRR